FPCDRAPPLAQVSLGFPPDGGTAEGDLASTLLDHLGVAGQHIDKQLAQRRRVLPKLCLQGPRYKGLPITPAACRTIAKEDGATSFLHQHSPRHHIPQPRAADDRPLERATRRI